MTDVLHEVMNSTYISILADSSTVISVQEQELVYIRYVDNSGRAQTILANIGSPENSHASEIFQSIKKALLLELNLKTET